MSSAIGSIGTSSYSQDLLSVAADRNRSQKMGQPPEPPDPAEMFSKIDTDGDGELSTDELSAFQSTMEENAPPDGAKGPKPPDASQMLSDMDADGNGAISEDEWTTFMQKMQEEMQSKRSQVGSYNSQGGESGLTTSSTLLDARV
jgi:Ca2+-binding EF-hand superfamily protein